MQGGPGQPGLTCQWAGRFPSRIWQHIWPSYSWKLLEICCPDLSGWTKKLIWQWHSYIQAVSGLTARDLAREREKDLQCSILLWKQVHKSKIIISKVPATGHSLLLRTFTRVFAWQIQIFTKKLKYVDNPTVNRLDSNLNILGAEYPLQLFATT